jgi:hypothetical protein
VPILAFIVRGGTTYAATGDFLTLGNPNSATSTTSLSAPVAGNGLQVTNTSTGAGATALGLNVASGHPPFTVNSGTKVTNLNADKLDGMDSSAFVPGSKLVRIGPVTATPDNPGVLNPFIAKVGHFSFYGLCVRNNFVGNDRVEITIATERGGSTYGSMTQAAAGGAFGEGNMTFANDYTVVDYSFPTGTANFNPASGTAVAPDGQQLTFDLYQGMNDRGQSGQCIFGGTFVLKP